MNETSIAATAADIDASRGIDISNCRTVCLALGPYRNLTTLTAATLFLHPNCQVLNHAGQRIYGSTELDFLCNYSLETFERFMRYAIHISAGGARGDFGGSITHSHAFDDGYAMKQLFERAGGCLTKSDIRSLFWKESLLTANHIRAKQVDLADIFRQEPRLRFLLPVRHPLDCAVSNLKTGHFCRFAGIGENPDVRQVAEAILEELSWTATLAERFPGRFFVFYEHSIGPDVLRQLARFLQIEPLPEWIVQAMAAMDIKAGYAHEAGLLQWYQEQVAQRFAGLPKMAVQLLRFSAWRQT
jgi:hypothetical protein